jgi:hypothetical protein
MAEPHHTSSNGAAHGDADDASEKMPPKRLQRYDSLHMEAGMFPAGGSTHAAKVYVSSPTTLIQSDNDPPFALEPCVTAQ